MSVVMPGLRQPFHRLPVRFDARRLEDEVAGLPPWEWRPDRFRIAGYRSVPLVSYRGLDNDRHGGPWLACPRLERLPYLESCLRALDVPCSEVRLRAMAPGGGVPAHYDADQYWVARYRVHIPISTGSGAEFSCDGTVVEMAPGECWMFDRLRLHAVHNGSAVERIHLIVDTVGSGSLCDLMQGVVPEGSAALATDLDPGPHTAITPSAFREYALDLLDRCERAGSRRPAALEAFAQRLERARMMWSERWARGHASARRWDGFFALTRSLAEDVAALEAEGPVTELYPSVTERIRFFVRCAIDPSHETATTALDDARDVLTGDVVLRITADRRIVIDPSCGRAPEELELAELLLVAAIGRGQTPEQACETAGLHYDDAVDSVLDDLRARGILERRCRPLRWPWYVDAADDADDAPELGEAGDATEARFRELRWSGTDHALVCIRSDGSVGLWTTAAEYREIPLRLLEAVVELVAGASVADACAAGRLVVNTTMAHLVAEWERAGVVSATRDSAP